MHPLFHGTASYVYINDLECMHWMHDMGGSFQCINISVGSSMILYLHTHMHYLVVPLPLLHKEGDDPEFLIRRESRSSA
jgi:hypothetical protein